MKRRPQIIDRIHRVLKGSQTVCVVGHTRPDGDCIGSQLALSEALERAGKRVVCWNEDPVPQKFAGLDPQGRMQRPVPGQTFDSVVALDSANSDRLGRVVKHLGRRRWLINIDHHESNTRYGDLNWVSVSAASTGELVFQLLKMAGWPVTPPMADCLFAAVSTDTGSFQYPSTRPVSFRIAGQLLRLGAKVGPVCEAVYHSFPLGRVRLLRHVLNHFRLTCRNRIAYSWLKPEDYVRAGARADDSEGLIDHLRAIESVAVACIFEELEPDLVRVSLRSKNGRINVSDIAGRFGGGGHPGAAGARIRGRPLSVQRRLLAAIQSDLSAVESL